MHANAPKPRILWCLLLSTTVLLLQQPKSLVAELDFNRDVRPILSDKCYFCHGPDENDRQADLRLDLRSDEAMEAIESGELLDRVFSADADMVMPPTETKLRLTENEKSILQRWVNEGAEYEAHWAFQSLPKSVPRPATQDKEWCIQPIDDFVLANLESKRKEPTHEAQPLRWLRRVTFDLTGLPPSPEQISKFETALDAAGPSKRETVFEDEVGRLLRSPAFGEHFAIAWLDAARYADSYGYQSDKLNTQWPYRDWVVRAFNDNLPYDQFLTWQLAGDLLPNPTRDQKLATAFNRIHRLNNEGGAVFEEWRIENVADRVQTFGTAILGLTMECCRCHDHKYDPISSRDYYSLSAFFNSIDESGVYDRTAKVPAPSLLLPTEKQAAAILSSKRDLRVAQLEFERVASRARERFPTWRMEQDTRNHNIPDLLLALSFDKPFDDSLKAVYHPSQNDRGWTSPLKTFDVANSRLPRLAAELAADVVLPAKDSSNSTSLPRLAIQLDGERGITVENIEPFDRWTPFSVIISMRETRRVAQRAVLAHHTRGTDCGYNGWDLTLVDGFLESRLYRVWPGNAIGVRTTVAIPANQWHQVAATYDGSSEAEGLKLFLNGKQLKTTILRNRIKKSANVVVDHGGQFVLGQRFRARGLAGGLVDDLQIYNRDLSAVELTRLATGNSIAPTEQYFLSAVDESVRRALSNLTSARKAYVMAEEDVVEIPIMEEMNHPRETHLLARGQYDAETSAETLVDRATFTSILPAFPADAPRNRLGLAAWATHPDHPLTSRVMVNRLWHNFFGDGLVSTPENFGLQGELPSHPALLDWLARDFVDHGWDIKRFCKQVVLSATYRQDSVADRKLIQSDPKNVDLARGPACRLAAEQIRDMALSASGLLNPARGGPPVSPYQAGGDLWKESNGMSPPYQQSVGKELYRRSLYSVWKRTAPLPNMMAFDAESREVCIVKRARTNTPLQALVLMNDVQFVEAARKLAESTLQRRDGDGDRIAWAFQCLTGRQPDTTEAAMLAELLDDERIYYRAHPEEAEKLVALGESPADQQVETGELAAVTTVCQVMLNLDATIWKR